MSQPSDQMSMPGAQIEIYKTLDDVALRLWIFTPEDHKDTDRRPAIVCYHGGGWVRGLPDQFHKHCEYLAARGMVAITVEYRLQSVHQSTVNLCVADAKSAMRWTRTHAKRLGIDKNRIVAGGSSAGGLLAAATATLDLHDDPNDDASVDVRPNALVLLNPVLVMDSIPGKFDFSDWAASMNDILELEFESLLGVDGATLSPYHHMTDHIGPTIIFHGTGDDIVPFETAEVFREKMSDRGNRCELFAYKGAPHGYFNYGRDHNAPYVNTVHKIDRFLVSLGYLNDVPTTVHYK